MNIYYGDLFECPERYDAICVTTNGIVKKDGSAVMGAGIAKMFAQKYPSLPKNLGEKIKAGGNHAYLLGAVMDKQYAILSFPTKEHFKDKSDIELIKRSCRELVAIADRYHLQHIYFPAPGCGLGGLILKDVCAEIEKILDDRFVLVIYEEDDGT